MGNFILTSEQEASEILPVVDERDRVIGCCRRDEIHRLGLRHRASHILVFDPQNRLFLQRRGLHKESSPGLWDSSVAGHVDHGESYDQCCLREMEEEIGIHVTDAPEQLFKLEACPATGMEFSWIYRLVTEESLSPNFSEMEAGQWYEVTEVDRNLQKCPEDFSETFHLIWARYRGWEAPIR